MHPPKTGEKKAAFVRALVQHSDIIGLQMRPPKDADPGLIHSKY